MKQLCANPLLQFFFPFPFYKHIIQSVIKGISQRISILYKYYEILFHIYRYNCYIVNSIYDFNLCKIIRFLNFYCKF